jgi:protocatechuate 3,4-dioxygenase beta subunit
MNSFNIYVPRRAILQKLAAASALYAVTGAFAEALTQTPAQTEGPFYPDHLPLDTDNDLVVINNATTPALGEITWLSGKLLDATGAPIRNALIEIWQVDHNGVYIHSKSNSADKHDQAFQGFGRFLTGATGEYVFRTIKPVSYPGRAPHIHMAVKIKGREKFTTQCYVKGDAQNEKDGVIRGIKDEKARDSCIVDFAAIASSKAGELAAKFDIVMGFTPEA